MCSTIEIEPKSLKTDVTITAFVHADHLSEPSTSLLVKPLEHHGLDPFAVPLAIEEGIVKAQFTLSVPGRYSLQLGNLQRDILVERQATLSFRAEFGLLAIAVMILVGGILYWTRRTNRRMSPS